MEVILSLRFVDGFESIPIMQKMLLATVFVALAMAQSPVAVAAAPITRRDGFLLLWNSIRRPALRTSEAPFSDLPKGSRGELEITFAKSRGLIDSVSDTFRPDEPLSNLAGLLWLFRTRSMDPAGDDDFYDDDGWKNVPELAEKVGLGRYVSSQNDEEKSIKDGTMTEEDLLAAMRLVDAYLRDEEHEVSLYSEKFHGKGTAFGESFDMYAMTAAHRTFPANTLIEVTNVENGKSVVVRINDRGPYVDGRDLDLSLGAFTSIAERSRGKIMATFRRLGDASLVGYCDGSPYAVRLGRTDRLSPGFPVSLPLGQELSVGANEAFVVRSVRYPDGNVNWLEDWILKTERYRFKPSVAGEYVFRVSSKDGQSRDFTMKVANCSS